jgi:hypothetical protein
MDGRPVGKLFVSEANNYLYSLSHAGFGCALFDQAVAAGSLIQRESRRMSFASVASQMIYKNLRIADPLNKTTPREPTWFVQRKNGMKKNLVIKILSAVLMVLPMSTQVYAEGVTLVGKWYVLPDGKSKVTLLTLSQSGNLLTGTWAPDKGTSSEIENAKIAGDILTFSFISEKKQFNATGHVNGGTMSFDIIGPKNKTIHAQAARGDM